jgi:hypothetical protein
MAVFGTQRPENRPKYSHTFATFVRACWCNGGCRVDSFTISWLPRRGLVQPLLPVPEPGRNFDLAATLRLADLEQECVSVWGPYQICPSLYQRAWEQKVHLESGRVAYKAVDTGWPSTRVSNCIHAVSDLDGGGPPLRIASPGWGDPASYYTVLHLLPAIVDPCCVHEWIYDALGLRGCNIRRRDLREGNPAESPALRALMETSQRRLERRAREVLSRCPPYGP